MVQLRRLLFLFLAPFAVEAFISPTFHHSKLTTNHKNSLRHFKNSQTITTMSSQSTLEITSCKRLVLVGGGHAHLQVIKALNHASRPEDLEVVLVDLTGQPCYSGMVPSTVAGIYDPSEPLIDLEPLANWSQIRFVRDRVVDIDVDSKVLTTRGNEKIAFDAVSIDIGSASRGLEDVPGARENTIPTRPITELVRRIEEETKTLKEQVDKPKVEVAVVGGGAAGIELAMNVLGRWKPIVGESNISVTILSSFDKLLPSETRANQESLMNRLAERNIQVVYDATVTRIDEDSLLLDTGERFDFTHCLFATGAGCHSQLSLSLRDYGLAVSDRGWIQVNESFQSVSHPFVFAAGDCCTLTLPGGAPSPPKAGVYAVRAGPILIENLTRYLYPSENSSLEKFEPQPDFLKLLACGDGKALGFRFGIPIYGKWVYQLKDTIDRSFMDLFRLENLPELVPGQPYDTSQYDAVAYRPPPIPAFEAAILLKRTDDDVDYETAWNALRDMAQDEEYKENVLSHMGVRSLSEDAIAAVA